MFSTRPTVCAAESGTSNIWWGLRTLTGHLHHVHGRSVEFASARVMNDRSVKDGSLYSARGVSDGIQMALSLVREDLGSEFAGSIAKSLSRHHT